MATNISLSQPRELTESASRVLRSTYILLAITLAFSAFTAWLNMNVLHWHIGWGISLVGFIGLVFAVQALSNSAMGIVALFGLTGFMGLSLAPILTYTLRLSHGGDIVMLAMAGTAAIFFAMSAIVLTTKRDFGFLGNFLLVGLIAIIVLSVANIFLKIPMLSLALSIASVLLFSAFILWDTSDIIEGRETNYILATMGLFINVFNIFQNLLFLLGLGDE